MITHVSAVMRPEGFVISDHTYIDAPMVVKRFVRHFFGRVSGILVRNVIGAGLLGWGQDRDGPLAVEGRLL
jgi:hypothetical protein